MKKVIFAFLILNAISSLKSQTFTCQISQKTVLLGNFIEVEYKFSGGQNAQFVQKPDFSGFDIVGGPNQSSNITMVNGKTDASISFTYLVEPRDTGTFVIPSATMKNDDKTWISEPVDIQVLPNPDGIIEQPSAKENDFMDFFGRQFGGEERQIPTEKPKNKRKTVKI
jgi:BatD DUF11 like domain